MREYIESQISERRNRIASLEHDLLTIKAEVSAYEDMLRHIDDEPKNVRSNEPGDPGKRNVPSRKATSTSFQLSEHWAKILRILAASGRSFDASDIVEAADRVGKSMKTPNARSQIAYYKKKKVFRRIQPGKYILTDTGREMLKKDEAPAEESTGAPRVTGEVRASPFESESESFH